MPGYCLVWCRYSKFEELHFSISNHIEFLFHLQASHVYWLKIPFYFRLWLDSSISRLLKAIYSLHSSINHRYLFFECWYALWFYFLLNFCYLPLILRLWCFCCWGVRWNSVSKILFGDPVSKERKLFFVNWSIIRD